MIFSFSGRPVVILSESEFYLEKVRSIKISLEFVIAFFPNMPSALYQELQVEETPTARNYKRLGLIAGAIILGCAIVIILATTVPNSGKGNSNEESPYFAFTNDTLLGPGPKDGIPCIVDTTNSPAGCKQRIVPCGTNTDLTNVKAVIPPATDTACKNTRVYVGEVCILTHLPFPCNQILLLFAIPRYSSVLQRQTRMLGSQDGDGGMLGKASKKHWQHIFVSSSLKPQKYLNSHGIGAKANAVLGAETLTVERGPVIV